MNAGFIEMAVARSCFPYQRFILAPNISWGLGLNHECDLLAVSERGYAHEIEIKVSVSDCKRDALKRHNHRSNKIRYFWFAVPEAISEKCIPFIPDGAGIIVVDEEGRGSRLRQAKIRTDARPLSEIEILKLHRLLSIRYWCNRSKVDMMKEQIKNLRKGDAHVKANTNTDN